MSGLTDRLWGPLEGGPGALGSHCSEWSPQKGLLRDAPLHQQDLKEGVRLACAAWAPGTWPGSHPFWSERTQELLAASHCFPVFQAFPAPPGGGDTEPSHQEGRPMLFRRSVLSDSVTPGTAVRLAPLSSTTSQFAQTQVH